MCRLLLAYDGTDFHGFAAQRDQRTVAGVLGRRARARCCAPRSTSHARGGPTPACTRGVRWSRSRRRPASTRPLAVLAQRHARPRGRGPGGRRSSSPDFDARHSAPWRAYRYTIVNRPDPDPFLRPIRVARARAARSRGVAPRCRPVRGRRWGTRVPEDEEGKPFPFLFSGKGIFHFKGGVSHGRAAEVEMGGACGGTE